MTDVEAGPAALIHCPYVPGQLQSPTGPGLPLVSGHWGRNGGEGALCHGIRSFLFLPSWRSPQHLLLCGKSLPISAQLVWLSGLSAGLQTKGSPV